MRDQPMPDKKRKQVEYPAIRVDQWLSSWDSVRFLDAAPRTKPEPFFFVLALPARVLRTLAGVERRTTTRRLQGGQDYNLQRKLEADRVEEIASFVENGFPWSELTPKKRASPEYANLRMP